MELCLFLRRSLANAGNKLRLLVEFSLFADKK
jgi:hypothetical protein